MTGILVLDFDKVITRNQTYGFQLRTQVTKESVLNNITNPHGLRNTLRKAFHNGIPVAIASHAAAGEF